MAGDAGRVASPRVTRSRGKPAIENAKTVEAPKATGGSVAGKKSVSRKAISKEAVTKKDFAKLAVAKGESDGAEVSTAAAEPAESTEGAEGASGKPAGAKRLSVGDAVPSKKLTREDGEVVDLRSLAESTGLAIFMYPRANTGGCTKQALGFKAEAAELRAAGFEVYGLSFDSPKSQSNWKSKYGLPYHLLTDSDGSTLRLFGALKPPRSILRSHVLIARGGSVLDVRNGVSPGDSYEMAAEKARGHATGLEGEGEEEEAERIAAAAEAEAEAGAKTETKAKVEPVARPAKRGRKA